MNTPWPEYRRSSRPRRSHRDPRRDTRWSEREKAAQVAGISRDTLYDWLGRAKRDKTGVFAMFAEEYGRAARYGATLKMNALLEAMK